MPGSTFAQCARCQIATFRHRLHFPPGYADGVCPQCALEVGYYCALHEWEYKPTPLFLPTWAEGELFLGVELETDDYPTEDAKDDALNALDELSDAQRLFYLKGDSSLTIGFEVVTHPATLRFHQNTLPWDSIIQIITQSEGKSHDTKTCGLHIHFNTNFFGYPNETQNTNILKLLYLVERHWSQIACFSRRSIESLDRWAQRYHKRFSTWTPTKLEAEKHDTPRHSAVNIRNHDTLEVRVFKGTLHLPTILASLELVDYIARTIKEATILQLQKTTWRHLVAQIDPQTYPHLIPYLLERKLIYVPNHRQKKT